MSALDQLKPLDRAFVQAYTDPDSPTYSNGTQSLLAVKPNINYESARTMAVRKFANANVKTSIQEIFDKLNITKEVRADRLKSIIADGKTSKVTMYDGEGNIRQVIEQPIKAADVCKAVDLMNKMDGTYDEAALPAKLAEREYMAMFKAMRREVQALRDVTTPQTAAIEATAHPDTIGTVDSGIQAADAATGQGEGIAGNQGQGTGAGAEGLAGVSPIQLSPTPETRSIKSLGGVSEATGSTVGIPELVDDTGYGGGI